MTSQQIVAEGERKWMPIESSIEAQKRLTQEFELFDDWSERYQTLVDFGRRLAPMPNTLKAERNRIRNCRGDTWLAGEARGGFLHLWASSDTDIVAGLLALIIEIYSGRPANNVFDHPLTVLEVTGLHERLSPHRLAAVQEIMERLRALATNAAAVPSYALF